MNAVKKLSWLPLLWLFLSWSLADADPYALYRLPDALASQQGGVVSVRYGGDTFSYVPGIGWSPGNAVDAPVVQGGEVFVTGATVEALGLTLPRLEAVRASRGEGVRIVFDLAGLEPNVLTGLESEGDLVAGMPLSFTLPPLLLPVSVPENVYGVDVAVATSAAGTQVSLTGPTMHYRVFDLQNPTRLVVDVTPADASALSSAPSPVTSQNAAATSGDAEARLDRQDSAGLAAYVPALPAGGALHPGVHYRRTTVATNEGPSYVDIVEIAPGSGEFRVVGESYVPRTLSELSSGGLVGINASYFDTKNRQTIGLLEVDNALLSYPSRNRAGIGFGAGKPVIDRIQATFRVRINGRVYTTETRGQRDDLRADSSGDVSAEVDAPPFTVHTAANALAGTPREGAIVIQNGRVLENKIGPRRVPEGGFVVTYKPDLYNPTLRELALVNTGDTASLDTTFDPPAFNAVRYAVEAGPLLVREGRAAFEPWNEAFDVEDPESPVNRRTTRAAVGVKADGTVLFVTATNMTARELVPLFLSLGATDALQMDSGGSSTLYAAGQTLNRPAFTQRKISTAIVFVPY